MPGRGGRGIDYRYLRTVPRYLSNDVPILRFNQQQHQNLTVNVVMNLSPSPTEKQDDSILSDDEYDGYYSQFWIITLQRSLPKIFKTNGLQRKLLNLSKMTLPIH